MELLGETISNCRTIHATFNGGALRLSPHQVLVRKRSLFFAAFNAERSRRFDEEPTLGGYNLAGVSQLAVTDERFEPLPSFEMTGIHPGMK